MFSFRSGWQSRIGLLVIVSSALFIVSSRFGLSALSAGAATALYGWALLMGAFALLLGIANALWYHLLRVQRGQKEWLLSLLLLVVFMLVFGAGATSPAGASGLLAEWVFDAVLAPGQATLYALSGVFLVSAAYFYLRVNRPGGLWILGGALLTLLAQTPFTYQLAPQALIELADWLLTWPVMAAMRGVLLGGALAVLFVGLRLVMRSAE